MRIIRLLGLSIFLAALAAVSAAVSAQERASWPAECRVGVFLPFFPDGADADRLQREFRVELVADQVASTGADYFGMTQYRHVGWENPPEPPYGEKDGTRACDELLTEMADAAARRGIKFFICVNGDLPGAEPPRRALTPELAQKWAGALRYWSALYGEKVFAWRIEGCRADLGFDEETAALFRGALRSGNPNALVTFDPGEGAPDWKSSDFTAGKTGGPPAPVKADADGRKTQILVCLGESRGAGAPRLSADAWTAWAKSAAEAGAAVTLESGLTTAEGVAGPGGFGAESLGRIRAVVDAVKGYTPEGAFRRAVEYDWLRQEIAEGRSLESSEALAALCARIEPLLETLEEEEYIAPDAAAALREKLADAREGDFASLTPPQIRKRYLALRWQTRDVIFDNPLVKGIPIVFLKADRYVWQLIHEYLSYYYSHTNMVGGELMLLKNPGRSFEAESISEGKFPRGWFSTPSLSFDGRTLYFAFADFSKVVPEDAERKTLYEIIKRGYDDEIEAYLAREEGKFHLFKMDLKSGAVEQLTDGPDDDFDPAELPDGDLVFMSTRRGGFARCTGGYEPVETATLYRRAQNGRVRPLSWHETNEWNPSMLDDGRVIYSRWDYVDREAARFMNLWVTNPDGTGAKALFGNYTTKVVAALQAKQIPGSNKSMFLASGHHIAVGGPIVILDPSKMKYDPKSAQDTLDCLDVVTPGIGFPETPVPGTDGEKYYVSSRYYYSPYPLSEDFYLTAYSHDPNGGYLAHENYGYRGTCGESYSAGKLGLYYRDRFGNLELIYADPQIGCQYPIQVKARPKPPVIASQLPKEAPAEGTFVLSDVYDSIVPLPKDRPIKELRVFQILPHWPDYTSGVPRLGKPSSANGRAFLGTVPVEEDGSAHFKVPAGKPLYFQAVDAEGKAVHTMMSEVYLQPGENRGCVGCHEQVHTASENFPAQKKAFQRAPSEMTPGPEGTAPFSFPVFLQPIIDRKCAACHSGAEDGVRPDLRGAVEHGVFSVAYNSLTEYTRWYQWGGDTIAPITSLPGEGGADMSRLTAILDDGNHGEKIGLTDADRRAFYLWMDANVPFYGTGESETRAAELEGKPVPMPPVQ